MEIHPASRAGGRSRRLRYGLTNSDKTLDWRLGDHAWFLIRHPQAIDMPDSVA